MRYLPLALCCMILYAPDSGAQAPYFPGAMGWAATTPGGRGGRIIRVTNLSADGPGSFAEAVKAKGPRIVVFEVGGVIDFGRKELDIREPFLTIAGQTAPSPGITIIRGGINMHASDVIMRHIRIKTGADGAAKRSGPTGGCAYGIPRKTCTPSCVVPRTFPARVPTIVMRRIVAE